MTAKRRSFGLEGSRASGPAVVAQLSARRAGSAFRHYAGGSWVEVTNAATEAVSAIDMVSSDDGQAMASFGGILHKDGVAEGANAAVRVGIGGGVAVLVGGDLARFHQAIAGAVPCNLGADNSALTRGH